MALIPCRNCGKDVSDKAKVCPHCGAQLIEEQAEQPQPLLCEECGAEIPPDAEACPNCGCPVAQQEEQPGEPPQKVELTAVKLPKLNAHTKKLVLGGIIAAVVIILAIILIVSRQRKSAAAQLSADYGENLETITSMILTSAVQTEDAGQLIRNVWYNCIFEERDNETDPYTRPNGYFLDDFNEALAALFADEEFNQRLQGIETSQDSVTGIMRELGNPPAEYEEAYQAGRELYDAYMEFTNLVLNPSGNLQTFTANFNDADSELLNCYNAMSLYIGG